MNRISLVRPSMETHKPEYQHYIPQFLLRNFSHKYVPPGDSKAGKSRRRSRKKKMYAGDPVVNSLCLTDEFFLEECSVKRVCGLENMYDTPAKPLEVQPRLEKKFSEFERKASCIYRQITNSYRDGKQAVLLKRAEKDLLRKFMFLLTYRGKQYYQLFNVDSMQDYDADDKELLQAYMAKHGFTKPIDVWLQSLEKIIDLDIDIEGSWKWRICQSIYFPFADRFIDHIMAMYMAICTPANDDEEFVLTENCYNVHEGQTTSYYDSSTGKHTTMSPRFHRFAPISPKLAIVLRSNLLPEPYGDINPDGQELRQFERLLWIDSFYGSGTKSILEDLPVHKPATSYLEVVNGRLVPRSGWDQQLGMDDSFCFTIFPIPTRHVRTINGLLIDHAFHGSRIIFDRKDVFLDLLEWYLTEPCEVGKNIFGKHVGKQTRYIEGLSDFMLREGRELIAKCTFWPSEHRDVKQFQIQNMAKARFFEEVRQGKEDADFNFEAVYKRLCGTVATYDEDKAMSNTMYKIWIRCVDLDWGSPGYESSRRDKLACLLDGYQQQSCARFWLFLKQMRLAQIIGDRSLELEQVNTALSDEKSAQGSEDMLVYAHTLIEGHELNVAMYKSFNESTALTRGPWCSLESMGIFWIFGSESWRIPNPFSRWNRPCQNNGVKEGPSVRKVVAVKEVRPSLFDTVNRKASRQSLHQNQQRHYEEIRKIFGTSKITHALPPDTENRKIQTDIIEQITPYDNNKAKDEAYIKNTAHPSQFHSEGWKPRTSSIDPKKEAVEQPKYYVLKDEYASIMTLVIFTGGVIVAALTFFSLGVLSYLLVQLFYFLPWLLLGLAWLLNGLAWLLDTLWPAFFTIAKLLFCTGLIFGYGLISYSQKCYCTLD
ncbi:hypothetical protein GGI43DRAFT_59956 [Trichoderma evansii]